MNISGALKKLSEDFQKLANELQPSEKVFVYSFKTLQTGLQNCYIGLKRAQEAVSDVRYGAEFESLIKDDDSKASKASTELKKVAEEKKNYSSKKSTRKKDAQ